MTADELKTIRAELGLTQHQMATRLAMTRPHYATLETGKNRIRPIVAMVIRDIHARQKR